MIRLLPLFLLCGTLLPVQAQPAGDAAPASDILLNGMATASRRLNYEGIFVFTRGDRMDVMRLVHKADAAGEREKIVSLTGPAREIIRNNHTVTCVFPDTQEVMIERSRLQSFPASLPGQIGASAGLYQFETAGTERIAGRDTWVVNILPKDDFRYGYRLWIDKDSHLLLKSELRDEAGDVLESAMFAEVQLHDEIADELFAPSIKGKQYTWYQYNAQVESEADTETVPADTGWRITWLPDGFRLNMHNEKSSSVQAENLHHIIYSDGVSMVSVFIEKLQQGVSAAPGARKLGGVNVYARTSGSYQFTAVGEVPQATVMRIVDSIIADH